MKNTALVCSLLMLSGCGLSETCTSCLADGENAARNGEVAVDSRKVQPKEEETCNSCFVCNKNKDKKEPLSHIRVERNTPAAEKSAAVFDEGMSCEQACLSQSAVIKPRVKEQYNEQKLRRSCPEDVLVMEQNTHAVVPNIPEAYMTLGGRVVEDMLEGAKAVYEMGVPTKFYVENMTVKADDLPGGADKGIEIVKKRLNNVNQILLVDKPEKAEYVVSSEVDWFDTSAKKVPAIKYLMTVKSSDGTKIGEWTEVVRRLEDDKSWW